jgi:hypothetical protein
MALVGITTALLVNMLGQARIWTMAAREHMIPSFWAKVSPRFGTPIAAQITMGGASGVHPLPMQVQACWTFFQTCNCTLFSHEFAQLKQAEIGDLPGKNNLPPLPGIENFFMVNFTMA